MIHETLLRSRTAGGAGNTPQPYWPTLHAYIDANRDREALRQQLTLHAERWQRAPRFVRWRYLAGWWRRLEYRRLRPAPSSLEARFLTRSRRASLTTGLVVTVVAAPFVASAVWAVANNLSLAHVFVGPLWHVGLAIPALPEAVTLQPGRFLMGCKVGRDVDAGAKCPDEEPLREVTLANPCAIGRTDVTFWQYDYYVWASRGEGAEDLTYPNSAGFGREDRPVINLNWHDAQGYARWLSQRTGQRWRLPTEEEWEYAARGGQEARYPWGNEPPNGRANCRGCGDGYSNRMTAPVGSYAPNAFSLYDMAGNVWKWLEDKVPDNEAARVMRGGSWHDDTRGLRASNGIGFVALNRINYVGFRVCRVSSIEKPATGALPTEPPKR